MYWAISSFLVLNVVAGIEETNCWLVVVGVAVTSVLYSVRGGSRAGVLTDALQSITMIIASFVLWGFVYSGLGGWEGVTARLEAVEEVVLRPSLKPLTRQTIRPFYFSFAPTLGLGCTATTR